MPQAKWTQPDDAVPLTAVAHPGLSRSTAKTSGAGLTMTGNTLDYSLMSNNRVVIKMFALDGRCRGTLVDAVRQPGQYRMALPPRLAEGTFILSLRAGEWVINKKVMIGDRPLD